MDSQKRRKYYESKKTKSDAEQAQAALERAARQLTDGDYAGAVQTCQEFLPLAQERPFQRAEFLNCMGTGNMMLREYDAAYDAFTETLEIVSNDPYLWYNRGIASRMTMRSGQALQDFERAVVLEGTGSCKVSTWFIRIWTTTRRVGSEMVVGSKSSGNSFVIPGV
jgi:tetratricopeptide (TPR) repeat protein